MHHTTLRALREAKPYPACQDRYAVLVAGLGDGWGDDQPITLTRILEINGLSDAIWSLRANLHPDAEREARLFACDCAEAVVHLADDPRSVAAIEVARRYAYGQATTDELSAAWNAVWATACAAANTADCEVRIALAAARNAARATACAAARVAACSAARAAARVAAREKQAHLFRQRFGEVVE